MRLQESAPCIAVGSYLVQSKSDLTEGRSRSDLFRVIGTWIVRMSVLLLCGDTTEDIHSSESCLSSVGSSPSPSPSSSSSPSSTPEPTDMLLETPSISPSGDSGLRPKGRWGTRMIISAPPPGRRRRSRTQFSGTDLSRLEAVFSLDPYPDVRMRELLAQQLKVTEDRVQVWFQNHRAKTKRHLMADRRTKTSSMQVATSFSPPPPPTGATPASYRRPLEDLHHPEVTASRPPAATKVTTGGVPSYNRSSAAGGAFVGISHPGSAHLHANAGSGTGENAPHPGTLPQYSSLARVGTTRCISRKTPISPSFNPGISTGSRKNITPASGANSQQTHQNTQWSTSDLYEKMSVVLSQRSSSPNPHQPALSSCEVTSSTNVHLEPPQSPSSHSAHPHHVVSGGSSLHTCRSNEYEDDANSAASWWCSNASGKSSTTASAVSSQQPSEDTAATKRQSASSSTTSIGSTFRPRRPWEDEPRGLGMRRLLEDEAHDVTTGHDDVTSYYSQQQVSWDVPDDVTPSYCYLQSPWRPFLYTPEVVGVDLHPTLRSHPLAVSMTYNSFSFDISPTYVPMTGLSWDRKYSQVPPEVVACNRVPIAARL